MSESKHKRADGHESRARDDVRSFLLAIEEASPLIKAIARHPGVCAEISEVQREMGILYGYQQVLTERIAKRVGLKKDDASHRWVIRGLSASLGEMIADVRDDDSSLDGISDSIEVMIGVVERYKNEWNFSVGDGSPDVFSSDLKINTRLAILDAMRVIKKSIELLPMGNDVDETTSLTIKLVVDMAWDMSNGWKGDLSSHDREILFQGLIKHIGRAAAEAWESSVLQSWGMDDRLISEDVWEEMISPFRAFVIDMHMGHESKIEVVVSRARKLISDSAKAVMFEYADIKGGHRRVLQNALYSGISSLAVKAWQTAVDGVWERFDKMSSEEQRRWEQTEGSEPMDLSLFDDAFERVFAAWYKHEWSAPMDISRFEEAIKKNVVWLWGTADAVFRSNMASEKQA